MANDKLTTAQAIAETRKFAQFIKAFKHISEIADALEQAEQLVKERETRLAGIDMQIEKSTAELQALDEQALTQRSELTQAAQVAREARDNLLAKAEAKARGFTSDALERQNQLTAQADQAVRELKDIRQKLASAKAQLDIVQKQTAKVRENVKRFLASG